MPSNPLESKFRSWEEAARRFADAINQMGQGRSNAYGSLTLAASTAQTTLTDVNIGQSSTLVFTATNAAGRSDIPAQTTTSNGSAILSHDSTATTRTFRYAIIG